MAIEMLSARDAVDRIKSCTGAGQQVLGIDGFQIVEGGYIGRLDLILDLSMQPLAPDAAETEALRFVDAHAADDIMFEVVTASPSDS